MRTAVCIATLLLAGCSVAQGQTADSPPATPAPAAAGPAPAPGPVTLVNRPAAGPGERLYVEKCIMCHGAGGMGTGLLARRIDQPELEKRGDLAKNYVILAARQGIGNMPAIGRGDVSDAEMTLIAEYLAAGPHGVAQ